MAYISSNANRWYCAKEDTYGHVPAITAANRIPAVGMTAKHHREKSQRRDKTGSRTWAGLPVGMRHETSFQMTTYMRDWADSSHLPPHGPLFEAVMGGAGVKWAGGTANTGTDDLTVRFVSPHNLTPGQAVVSGGEIRFVAAVADSVTVVLNAPFTVAPVVGVPLGVTATYNLAAELPSVSLYDYWDPETAVQRVMCGAAVDRLSVKLNGDFHEFEFKGMAQDLVDSASFIAGQAAAQTFPAEPVAGVSGYSPVPGNLGQVWLGVIPDQLFTISQASIEVRNNLELRNKEFGSILPRGVTPGNREVLMSLELFGQDDAATTALYQAARQQDPVSVMFQLGQSAGQLMGIYVKSLIPDVPEFDDSEKRLKWRFRDTRAQGTTDDEIVVAFG
jgi:hypothetical protein